MLNSINRYWNTIKYLKIKQILYRVYYFTRNRLFGNDCKFTTFDNKIEQINYKLYINSFNTFDPKETSFTFLNKKKVFASEQIDWNYSRYGKLWCYNLNYFDFLLQDSLQPEIGLQLIRSYINNKNDLNDGLEPYTISLRNINWIKFLSKNNITNKEIDDFIYSCYLHLLKNLEYHIMGNHLLENAFSLFFGAYYFRSDKFYKKAINILQAELNEQILDDGAHFERSPMYHQIMLNRILDCYNLVINNNFKKNHRFEEMLLNKAKVMLSWINTITFSNGSIPILKDSTYDIAPSTKELIGYAKKLNIDFKDHIQLKGSGYRKFNNTVYEIIVDFGHIGPDYIPGHAHADTFNFIINYNKQEFIIDPGISTYEKNNQRQLERSTCMHNTVSINKVNSSDVWGGFRVGQRAHIFDFMENTNYVFAKHDGYKKLKIIHGREISVEERMVKISDKINGANTTFNPIFNLIISQSHKPLLQEDSIYFEKSNIVIKFEGHEELMIQSIQIPAGYNLFKKAYKVETKFNESLTTYIHF